MNVIRSLNSELVFIHHIFPMGPKGLTLKDGKISPSEAQITQMIAAYGPAVKPGDRARITDVEFKGDNQIRFEINGGPVRKKKWYEHIEVSGMGGSATPLDPTDPRLNARGSVVVLEFDKQVPEMTVDQLKEMLSPVFDFHSKSAVEAYLDTVPPKVKDAIKNHQALVGMDREMVTYAKGRPPRRIREKDGEVSYEEWIYGQPPQDVEFIRFVGDEVVRVETMKVDGEKLVRTEKEVNIERPQIAQQQTKPPEDQPSLSPKGRPTLRRPGEEAPPASQGPGAPLPPDPGQIPGAPPTAPPQPGNPMPTGPR